MIILSLATILSGMSVVLGGYNSQSVSLNNSWCTDHFAISEQGNCLYLKEQLSIYQLFDDNFSNFEFQHDDDLSITLHCNYSYVENNISYSFEFDLDRVVISVQTLNNVDYWYFSSIVDNDTLDSPFNISSNIMVGDFDLDHYFGAYNSSSLFSTQYDYELGHFTGFSSNLDLRFLSYQFNSLSQEELRQLGISYMGENPDYQTGYEQGSKDGYKEGFIDGANSTGSNQYQTGYDDGYSQGLSDGMSSGHITEIFSNIVQVGILPVNVFLAMLNFEVFGINVGQFVSGLLTIAIILIVVRVVTGSSASGGGKGSDSNGS